MPASADHPSVPGSRGCPAKPGLDRVALAGLRRMSGVIFLTSMAMVEPVALWIDEIFCEVEARTRVRNVNRR